MECCPVSFQSGYSSQMFGKQKMPLCELECDIVVFFFFFSWVGGKKGKGNFFILVEKKSIPMQKFSQYVNILIYFIKGFFGKIYTKVARFISLELKKACGLQIYSKKLDFETYEN